MDYVTTTTTSMETNNLSKAIQYAKTKHGNQMYGNKPYIEHLNSVAKILMDARFDEDIVLTCAYLHDVIEDTDATEQDIANLFGFNIAEHVRLLTNSIKTNHIGLSGVSAIVKVADRISNQEACIESQNLGLGFKYIKDYKYISKLCAGEALGERMSKSYRQLYKMIREKCVSELGISKQAFSNWIIGKSSPSYSTLEGLKRIGVDIGKHI